MMAEYDGPVTITQLGEGVVMVTPAEKNTQDTGHVHSADRPRGVPLGATPCAVCGEPLRGLYDVLAHQATHDRPSRPTHPYGAPSLPIYGRDVHATTQVPRECPSCAAPADEDGKVWQHRLGCPATVDYSPLPTGDER